MMFVKGLIIYGWGLVVTFILFFCIVNKLYQLSTYVCCLIVLQIFLLVWIVIDTVVEILRNSTGEKTKDV